MNRAEPALRFMIQHPETQLQSALFAGCVREWAKSLVIFLRLRLGLGLAGYPHPSLKRKRRIPLKTERRVRAKLEKGKSAAIYLVGTGTQEPSGQGAQGVGQARGGMKPGSGLAQ